MPNKHGTRLSQGGALFFGEIVKLTRLLPSRVEQGLAELATLGHVTADGFEGLRALLLPEEQTCAVRRRPTAQTS